jgi:hypothetical protein
VIALPTITTFILSVFSVCSVALKNAPENLRKITLNYAKQSQFPKKQNCRNFFFTKNLRKNSPKKTPKKQSQTNPISERPKMNAYSFLQRTYAQILSFYRQKNKAKTNPISKMSKNEHKPCLHKGLRKFTPVAAKKTNPKQTQLSGKTEINATYFFAKKRRQS